MVGDGGWVVVGGLKTDRVKARDDSAQYAGEGDWRFEVRVD